MRAPAHVANSTRPCSQQPTTLQHASTGHWANSTGQRSQQSSTQRTKTQPTANSASMQTFCGILWAPLGQLLATLRAILAALGAILAALGALLAALGALLDALEALLGHLGCSMFHASLWQDPKIDPNRSPDGISSSRRPFWTPKGGGPPSGGATVMHPGPGTLILLYVYMQFCL